MRITRPAFEGPLPYHSHCLTVDSAGGDSRAGGDDRAVPLVDCRAIEQDSGTGRRLRMQLQLRHPCDDHHAQRIDVVAAQAAANGIEERKMWHGPAKIACDPCEVRFDDCGIAYFERRENGCDEILIEGSASVLIDRSRCGRPGEGS